MSSPLTLKKLPRRVSGAPTREPKMSTPLPNDSGDTLVGRALKGVVGLPNSCNGCTSLPSAEAWAGVADRWKCVAFLDGVSGMIELAKLAG